MNGEQRAMLNTPSFQPHPSLPPGFQSGGERKQEAEEDHDSCQGSLLGIRSRGGVFRLEVQHDDTAVLIPILMGGEISAVTECK